MAKDDELAATVVGDTPIAARVPVMPLGPGDATRYADRRALSRGGMGRPTRSRMPTTSA